MPPSRRSTKRSPPRPGSAPPKRGTWCGAPQPSPEQASGRDPSCTRASPRGTPPLSLAQAPVTRPRGRAAASPRARLRRSRARTPEPFRFAAPARDRSAPPRFPAPQPAARAAATKPLPTDRAPHSRHRLEGQLRLSHARGAGKHVTPLVHVFPSGEQLRAWCRGCRLSESQSTGHSDSRQTHSRLRQNVGI